MTSNPHPELDSELISANGSYLNLPEQVQVFDSESFEI